MSQSLNGNPYNGYINPYYWVDDHPLLCGNVVSLSADSLRSPALRLCAQLPRKILPACFSAHDIDSPFQALCQWNRLLYRAL